MKHATTRPTEPIDETSHVADAHADVGPPVERSAGAKAASGMAPRQERDDDVELVDESDLLDEMGFSAEQAVAHDAQSDRSEAKASPKRPKAPQLLEKGIRATSPAEDALVQIEARTPSVPPRPQKISSVPPPLPAEPAHVPTLQELANAEPVKHLPPPPRPLPPVPIPPASLRSHLDTSTPETVRESRRRKPRDRAIQLPSYAPGAVTIKTQRPSLPARPPRKGGVSWGWAAALVLVGVGAYAAGTMGARDPQRATPTAVAQNAARPSLPAPANEQVETRAEPQTETQAPIEHAGAEPVAAVDAGPEAAPPAELPASEPARDAAAPQAPIAARGLDAKTFAPREPETIAVPAPAPAKGLDTSAATSTLARAGARAVSCTDPRGGDGAVSVTFLPSGSPVNVKMSGRYEGTAVANCVEQIFRATRVAPFEGSATTIYYTVRLPGDGKPIN